jgi:hypothetical protein
MYVVGEQEHSSIADAIRPRQAGVFVAVTTTR